MTGDLWPGSAVQRTPVRLDADPARVVARLFLPGQELDTTGASRAGGVVARCLAMSEQEVTDTLAEISHRYGSRHRDLDTVLDDHFAAVVPAVPGAATVSLRHRRVIGAYFTREVSLEAAALFNPSVVPSPVQDAEPGQLRFVMSGRAVSEGHVSSIVFRSGTFTPGDGANGVVLDPVSPYVTSHAAVDHGDPLDTSYEVSFPADSQLSERALFPQVGTESNGVEDARFVRFTGDDGRASYLGTYTGFDGARIVSRRLDTDDFRTFRSSPLTGRAAMNKGMAIFPRRVGGRYTALSRWDRENNAIASSLDGFHWDDTSELQTPAEPWELIQLGNCGPPIETDAGWLVLTHGVGAMRAYALGAVLLDLEDPSQVLGRLTRPLLEPDASEREGYVPNVVYSCGSLVHNGVLLLPYGCSDSSIRVAVVDLSILMDRLLDSA